MEFFDLKGKFLEEPSTIKLDGSFLVLVGLEKGSQDAV